MQMDKMESMVRKVPLVHKVLLVLPVQTVLMELTVRKGLPVHKVHKVLPDREVVTIKI